MLVTKIKVQVCLDPYIQRSRSSEQIKAGFFPFCFFKAGQNSAFLCVKNEVPEMSGYRVFKFKFAPENRKICGYYLLVVWTENKIIEMNDKTRTAPFPIASPFLSLTNNLKASDVNNGSQRERKE